LIVAVTGHRPCKLGNEYGLQGPYSDYIREEIRKLLLLYRPIQAISGMALGVDTIFAQEALQLDIPLLASLPFKGQECKWPYQSQQNYHQILSNPLVTTFVVCEGGYNSAKMQIRNEYMVDNCNILISVWNGTKGGTMNCVRYAEKKKREGCEIEIIYINPENWKQQQDVQPSLF
jgi:uncharacterized phage-like protein YoqJ